VSSAGGRGVWLGLGVFVLTQWQFGVLAPEAARPGAMKRATALAIQRHLFEGGPDGDFTAASAIFAREWETFRASQPETNDLLRRLAQASTLPTELGADAPAADVPGLFCLALYSLLWRLAGQFDPGPGRDESERPDAGEEGETEDGAEDADAAPQGPAQPRDLVSVEHSHAVLALADHLQQLLRKPAATDETAPSRDHARLIAKGLLDCLLKAMPQTFALSELSREQAGNRSVTRRRILVRSSDLPRRIARVLRDLPQRFTVQPLHSPVAYLRRPEGRTDDDAEGINIPLFGYRRTNKFLRGFLALALRDSDPCFNFVTYIRAVDLQQAVPWRINVALWRQAEILVGLARDRADWPAATSAAVARADLDEDAVAQWRQRIADTFYRPEPGDRKRYNLPGEFLDSRLMQEAMTRLTEAGGDGAPQAFYLPWSADYRGRIHAETPWLTPQGNDLQKALFEFANGRSLDADGVAALRRHGGNLATGAGKTFAAREAWVVAHEREIVACAEAPLRHHFWWTEAKDKKRMQFLAFCMAYRRWRDAPDAPIHLPVQIDGTCNGLQHIAALTGDPALAKAVNVLPREDGAPGDIYSELAVAARETIGTIDPLLEQHRLTPAFREIVSAADRLLRGQPEWQDWIDRGVAKAVVMTVPYGASPLAQAREVLWKIEEKLTKLTPGAEAWCVAQGWAAALARDEEARLNLWRCARGTFAEPWRGGDPAARERVRVSRMLGGAVAWAIAVHLRAALRRKFPAAVNFSGWLQRVASRCEGVPLAWLTPLGFPVCQDKFGTEISKLRARLGGETITIGTERLNERVSPRLQEQALLPNLVHSLDATHLAMTLVAAQARGIADLGTIHDCLLCHPNDAARLAETARQSFLDLYRPEPNGAGPAVIRDWSEWMSFVARLKALRQAPLVKGALDRPEGLGESILAQAAASKDERPRAEAGQALALLHEIRGFDQARQMLARLLLDYVCDMPIRVREKPEQKAKHAPGGERRKIVAAWPTLTGGGALSPSATALSDYFFS